MLALALVAISTPAAAAVEDVQIAVEIHACTHGTPGKCFAAAADMERLHIKRILTHTPRELRVRALVMLDEQCRGKDGDACFVEARELVRDGVEIGRGLKLAERACTLGNGPSCLYLGDHYASGDLVRKDEHLATALFERACDAGTPRGCEQVAHRVSDKADIAALHHKACAGDDAVGCTHSGEDHLAEGDKQGASIDFMKACELGQLASCDSAGELTKNPGRARELFLRACDADVASGCHHIADMFAKGKGGARDWGQSITFAQKACELEHLASCPQAEQLAKHPPDWHCVGEEACKKLCAEHVGKACHRLAEMRDGAPGSYELACKGGDGESCLAVGHRAESIEAAAPWYALGCKDNDHASCLYAQYALARRGSSDARDALTLQCSSNKTACVLVGLTIAKQQPAQAEKTWVDACAHSDAWACRLVAHAKRGHDSEKYAKLACAAGDAIACNELPSFESALSAKRELVPAWD